MKISEALDQHLSGSCMVAINPPVELTIHIGTLKFCPNGDIFSGDYIFSTD